MDKKYRKIKCPMPTPETAKHWGKDTIVCRAVVGYLAFRDKVQKTASTKELCRRLNLDKATIKRAIGRCDFIKKSASGWKINEPPTGTFIDARTKGKHWIDQTSYLALWLAKSGQTIGDGKHAFTIRYAFVWSMLVNRQAKGRTTYTISGIARFCGMSRRTAARIVAGFVEAKLVDRTGSRIVISDTGEHARYFVSLPQNRRDLGKSPDDARNLQELCFHDCTAEEIQTLNFGPLAKAFGKDRLTQII